MQPQFMAAFGSIFFALYLILYIVIVVFLLSLLWRFTNAHERVAEALEKIAKKMKDDGQQP